MKKINITPTPYIDYLDLSGEYLERQGKYKFSLLSSDSRALSNEIYTIIDPSNDQAFKILFSGHHKINNANGFQRAKSLIESLLYKYNNNIIIKNINYWHNEIPELSGHNRKKLKVLDCPFICDMNNGKQYLIDLEMQNYYYDGLDLNSLSYGNALRNACNLPVIIVVLLFKDSTYNKSFEIKPFKKYLNEGEFKEIDDFVDVVCFDLYYILSCIKENVESNLNGFEISKEGKTWIKLLTIRDWMERYNYKYKDNENKRYPIQKNLNNSKEIISAIMILNSNDNSQLIKIVLKEKEKNIIEKDYKDKAIIEVWIQAFLKNKIPYQSFLSFPEVSSEFLIIKCKKILFKNNCVLFLNWLIENNIIESKNIYQELINKIYN